MDLVELAHQALAEGKKDGASQVEAYAVGSITKSVYVDDGRIKMVENKVDQGLAVRVLKGRKLAQASSACTSIADAEACARAASALADRSPSTPSYDHFPLPSKASSTMMAADDAVLSLEESGLVELVKATVGAAGDREIKVPRGIMRVASISSTVLNTNGVYAAHHGTLVFANYDAMAEGPTPGEGISSFNSPWLKDYDPQRTGEDMARQALAARGAQAMEGTINGPLLIAPTEFAGMLAHSVAMALTAESANKRRSPWASMEGQEVASEKITLVDDPTDPRGALSGPFDDEGVPATVKTVVENGVLRGFLYDSYNSSVAKKAPSGNGVRRDPNDAQYLFQRNLGCAPLNLVVRPGQRSQEQMIASLDRGVVVEKFAFPSVNPITGAFALETRLAHVVRKGAVEGQIKHALVVGNIYEGLKGVIEVGSDARTVGSMIVPTVAFDGFEVVGSKRD
jgi:PmbA protein